MKKYFITGVWKDDKENVKMVTLHKITGEVVDVGQVRDVSQIVQMLADKETEIHTAIWNYNTARFDRKSQVYTVDPSGSTNPYIKAKPNSKLSDNVDNLIRMDRFPMNLSAMLQVS